MSVSEIQTRSAKRARNRARRTVLGALPLSIALHAVALTGWLAAGDGPRDALPRRVRAAEVVLRWSPALARPRHAPVPPRPATLEAPAGPRPVPVLPEEFVLPFERGEPAPALLPWRAAEIEVTSVVRPRVPEAAALAGDAPTTDGASNDAPLALGTPATGPTATEPAPLALPDDPPSEAARAGSTPPVPRADNEPPRYPASALRRGHQGLTLVLVTVSAEGRALGVSLAATSGHASLDKAAVDAVGSWRFTPATRDGQPVEQDLEVPVRFQLRDRDARR